MLFQEQYLKYWIDHFYGYGSWQAPIWFIALEESGGELPEEVAERINYFSKNHLNETAGALCDIRALYSHLTFRQDRAEPFSTYYEYRFGQNAVLHGVWKNLISLAHGYRKESVQDVSAYQKHLFASSDSNNEALITLYPLPSPHNHAWYYGWLHMPHLDFLKNRALYQEKLYRQRMDTILSNIKKYKPELVLMYGMQNISALKQSFGNYFHDISFKMMKATKRIIPQHHYAESGETTVVITTQIPALKHNRIETGFDWENFGRSLSNKR